MPFLDELLELLPTVGLRLWMLDQTAVGWHAAVYEPERPLMSRAEAEGATAVEAVTAALAGAGVEIEA